MTRQRSGPDRISFDAYSRSSPSPLRATSIRGAGGRDHLLIRITRFARPLTRDLGSPNFKFPRCSSCFLLLFFPRARARASDNSPRATGYVRLARSASSGLTDSFLISARHPLRIIIPRPRSSSPPLRLPFVSITMLNQERRENSREITGISKT